MDRPINNRARLGRKPEVTQNFIKEKITYNVMLGNLCLGKSYFTNITNVNINGRLLNLMLVETKLTRFRDTERIYSDPQTLLPLRVERDISSWFVQEKITEDYNQEDFTLTVINKRGVKEEKTTIKKNSYIHNALLLPYVVRYLPKLDIGRTLIANLPNRRFEIKFVSIDNIKVPAGAFKAYHFISTPKQFEIWISADARRIPIRIHGNGIFGYSMVMSEYK